MEEYIATDGKKNVKVSIEETEEKTEGERLWDDHYKRVNENVQKLVDVAIELASHPMNQDEYRQFEAVHTLLKGFVGIDNMSERWGNFFLGRIDDES